MVLKILINRTPYYVFAVVIYYSVPNRALTRKVFLSTGTGTEKPGATIDIVRKKNQDKHRYIYYLFNFFFFLNVIMIIINNRDNKTY